MQDNTPIETNAQGGKGSVTYGGFHLGFPSRGALEVSHVTKQGAERYAVNNWRLCPPEEHYNHAVEHLMMLGDPNDPSNDPGSTHYEDHAAHAACRLLMMLETRTRGKKLAFHEMPVPAQASPNTSGSWKYQLQQGQAAKQLQQSPPHQYIQGGSISGGLQGSTLNGGLPANVIAINAAASYDDQHRHSALPIN